MRHIPIQSAKEVAEAYGYDQVVIYARRVGSAPDPHGEHMTTYGATAEHCAVAARIGDTLQRFMGWQPERVDATEPTIGAEGAAPTDVVTSEKLRDILMLEDDENLDASGSGVVEVCDGEWRRETPSSWRFHQNPDL